MSMTHQAETARACVQRAIQLFFGSAGPVCVLGFPHQPLRNLGVQNVMELYVLFTEDAPRTFVGPKLDTMLP